MPPSSNTFFQSTLYVGLLVGFGMFFNALLAFVNAHGIGVSPAHVIAMEILVVGGIALCVYPIQNKSMTPWAVFTYLFVVIFIGVAFYNAALGQSVSPKSLRDILLISAFGILGIVCYDRNIDIIKIFRIVCILVVGVMLLENYATEIYSSLFNVANYYASTRGIEERSIAGLDDMGLFVNTGLIDGRFSLGFLTTHRLSSLFLEQTTLGNFSVIISMATSMLWEKLTRRDKFIMIGTVVLTIMGTDSRLALGFAIIILIGHHFFHRIPRYSNLLIMPLFLLVCALVFYNPYQTGLLSDDLPGRFSWSIAQLSHIDLQGLFGGRPNEIGRSMDGGYAYFIYSQTIVGMIILWAFIGLIMPHTTVESRRMAVLLTLFITVNYMVGATLFSIKSAAILWLLVGYIYKEGLAEPKTKALEGQQ